LRSANVINCTTSYDAAVSGADPIDTRPGFAAMLKRIEGNGVKSIIVETATRFARDLTVQLTGHDYLKGLGVTLIPTTAPDFFTATSPLAASRMSRAPCR
jgi:DNA invertase Pin-like site-specific DNA recombinase